MEGGSGAEEAGPKEEGGEEHEEDTDLYNKIGA